MDSTNIDSTEYDSDVHSDYSTYSDYSTDHRLRILGIAHSTMHLISTDLQLPPDHRTRLGVQEGYREESFLSAADYGSDVYKGWLKWRLTLWASLG